MTMKKIILLLSTVLFLALSNGYAVELIHNPQHTTAVTVKIDHHLTQPKPTKKQSTALILAAVGLLLPIGLHRFYLGYNTAGIIMLVLTITGIGVLVSWVWTLIDLIRIANGTLKPADGSDYVDAI